MLGRSGELLRCQRARGIFDDGALAGAWEAQALLAERERYLMGYVTENDCDAYLRDGKTRIGGDGGSLRGWCGGLWVVRAVM